MKTENEAETPQSALGKLLHKLMYPDYAVTEWLQHIQDDIFDPSFAPATINKSIQEAAAIGFDKEIAFLVATEMVRYWDVDLTPEKTRFWVDHYYEQHAQREEEARKRREGRSGT